MSSLHDVVVVRYDWYKTTLHTATNKDNSMRSLQVLLTAHTSDSVQENEFSGIRYVFEVLLVFRIKILIHIPNSYVMYSYVPIYNFNLSTSLFT